MTRSHWEEAFAPPPSNLRRRNVGPHCPRCQRCRGEYPCPVLGCDRAYGLHGDGCARTGDTDLVEAAWLAALDGAPAFALDGCVVEPDGHCRHGIPSELFAAS